MAREKFADRYGVETYQAYKGDPARVKIPPAGHPLHDPTAPTMPDLLRCAEIDSAGIMNDPVEVWTDPDKGILWALDGRGRTIDSTEVNRKRKADKREPIIFLMINSPARTEKEAVARIQMLNHHRRGPTHSGLALGLESMRRAGWSWEECAAKLHVVTEDAEQWGRRLLPVAFCIPEVRAAIDAGKVPKGKAHLFGGRAVDGSERKGDAAQRALLAEVTAPKTKNGHGRPVNVKIRARVAAALAALESRYEGWARVIRFLDSGDAALLDEMPDAAADAIRKAMEPKPAGRPRK